MKKKLGFILIGIITKKHKAVRYVVLNGGFAFEMETPQEFANTCRLHDVFNVKLIEQNGDVLKLRAKPPLKLNDIKFELDDLETDEQSQEFVLNLLMHRVVEVMNADPKYRIIMHQLVHSL